MKILTSEKIPLKIWAEDIDEATMEQAKHLANFPFAFHHIAIMPDAHKGYGMPIGGIMATQKVVVPHAVGVDIGCGVCAVKTSLLELEQDTLKLIMAKIRKAIPLGFEHHSQPQEAKYMPSLPLPGPVVKQEYSSALRQLGTLGGGNHFIEIQRDSQHFIWIMVHCGSRNIGKKVADFYNQKAEELNQKLATPLPPEWELAYLPLEEKIAQDYLAEMNYCVEFAFANRKLILQRIEEIFAAVTSCSFSNQLINIAHNYAAFETHFRERVLVHRKGAVKATKDTIGVIPGSQGSKSYVVQGRGNKESFESCAHGAGRKMGREEARRILDLSEERAKLEQKGILHALRSKRDLDEASGAYKDIDKVMEQQKDLVKIIEVLEPLAVIKG